jgi:hypothetical protein
MNQYPYPNRGDISIDSDPQCATVYIDGYALQDDTGNIITTPVMVTDIMDGIHEIQISMDRYYSKKIFIDVIPGKVNKAFAKLIQI